MNEKQDLLVQIEEGMTVYDSTGEDIGEVEMVYHGAGSSSGVEPATVSAPPSPGESPYADLMDELFDPADDFPEEVAERLLYNGFIRIDSEGLFTGDRYVMPDQIASVSKDGVRLRVSQEELTEK